MNCSWGGIIAYKVSWWGSGSSPQLDQAHKESEECGALPYPTPGSPAIEWVWETHQEEGWIGWAMGRRTPGECAQLTAGADDIQWGM